MKTVILSLVTFPALRALLEKHGQFGRVLGTILFLAPLGTLMGLPFPVALHFLSPMAPTITPWVWGVNTVACVLGSVAAVSLAVSRGFQAVVTLGALTYILAGCWVRHLLAKPPRTAGVER